jgi:hypothetical protein
MAFIRRSLKKTLLSSKYFFYPMPAARFCLQVAAWVCDMFFIFYLVKSHKIISDSTTNEAREKISTDLESLELKTIDV